MRLADQIEYKPKKIYNQGTLPNCSAFAYLGALTENVEQEFGVEVEFDIVAEYNKMRASKIDKTFIERFTEIGKTDGFKSIDGKYLVKVEGVTKVPAMFLNAVRTELQEKGTLVWTIWLYPNYSLTKHDKDLRLMSLPVTAKRTAKTHAMFIAGYDKDKGFKFYNSWGTSQALYVDFETFKMLSKGLSIYSFDKISINGTGSDV